MNTMVQVRPILPIASAGKDLHPDLKADFILATPPFNMSDWGGENLRQDVRWKFGMPPEQNQPKTG